MADVSEEVATLEPHPHLRWCCVSGFHGRRTQYRPHIKGPGAGEMSSNDGAEQRDECGSKYQRLQVIILK